MYVSASYLQIFNVSSFLVFPQLKREVEEAISTCSILREENHKLEHHVKEQEQELDKTKSKIKSLKCQLNHVRKESHVKESEEEAANMKIQVM